uniref:CUB domain-containing protein-like n=1 Tax=Myxine glutinosa TaxID=7769 RepID=UPI00358F94F4
MKPKGHRESIFHGSMQGFLRLFLIQITVFSAASGAQQSEHTSLSPAASAVSQVGTDATVIGSTSSVFTVKSDTHPTSTTVTCGGQVRAEGWLSSPGYPQYIYSNMDCVWDIKAPLGHVVLLTVVDLNSQYYYYSSSRCYRSWLAVGYNQTSQRDITMCHYSDVGRTIISPSNTLRVFYHTSSYYGIRRFNVTLSSQGRTFISCHCWKCPTH